MIFFYFSSFLFLCAIIENKILFKFSALILGAYFSLTYAYGYDWLNYFQSYNSMSHGGDAFFGDIGYIFIMKACIFLGVNFGSFTFIVNGLLYFLVYRFCSGLKSSSFALFCLFSFLGFFMFTEQIRQGVALSIILYGFNKYFFQSKAKFVLCVFTASFFHLSGLMALLYLVIINESKKYLYISIAFSSMIYILFISLLNNPSLLGGLNIISSKFQAYGDLYSGLNNDFISFLLHSKMLFVYVFLALILYLFKYQGRYKYTTYASSYLLILMRSSSLLVRISYYFLPVFIFSIDDFISSLGKGLATSYKKIIFMLIILFVSTLPIWTPIYKVGAESNLNIFSTNSEINREYAKKCQLLHVNSDIRLDACY